MTRGEDIGVTVAGINVGGTKKGFHLVILRGGELLHVAAHTDPAELHRLCTAFDARVIGIDAPCRWGSETNGRSAERELARERISCFSTPTQARAEASTSGFYEWMFNGLRVYRAFEATHPVRDRRAHEEARECIETFPHAIACALLGRDAVSAKLKRVQHRALLERLGLYVARLTSIDTLDAALCAYTARLYVEGRARLGRRGGRLHLRARRRARLVETALTDVLDRRVIVETVLRAFASIARFLHAAEGRGLTRERAFVDADDARFELPRHAIDAAHVLALEKYDARPNGVSLAARIASASSSNGKSGPTEPKVSSQHSAMSAFASASTVGAK